MIEARDSPVLRLAVFAALAAFAAAHWAALVADPPVARAMLCVLALTAGAATLVVAGRAPLGPARRSLLAALAALATLAVALLVVGMPARLLAPTNWGELGSAIHTGLEGIEDVDYPYAGEHPWSRQVIMLALAVSLAAAVTLAFWPARNRAPLLRALALGIVVGVYAIAVITDSASHPLLRGLVLFLLVAAWLWLPGLARRHALAFGLLVAAAAAAAVPLASALNAERPWLDYRHWTINLSGGGGSESFHWNHRYGPLDWPRTGKRLLEVRSESAHYWRAAVLDSFDGLGWRSSPDAASSGLELPGRVAGGGAAWEDLDQKWIDWVGFSVDSLSSPAVLSPGAVQEAEGDVALTVTGEPVAEGPLEEGDAYAVRAYMPDPDSGQLRGAPDRFPPILSRFTTIRLPSRANPDGTRKPSELVTVPLRGGPRPSSSVAPRLAASAYAPVYALARRWTATAPTTYDAVEAIERGLQENYEYSEDPPSHRYPLRAFLLADRGGYCQHFSGAMALILRMVGIPSRVAAGFSPGERNGDRFVVRDTDSHSWVEVYFNGIGWVPFDPTPAAAPAQSQATGPPLPPAPAGRSALPQL
ncbi:MAG: transglutaminaseTgpA domain-containing protein, partial [Solirubrobacterales bacterium]